MTGGYRKIKLFSLMVALVALGLAVVGGTWATSVSYDGEVNTDDVGTFNVNLLYHQKENGYVNAISAAPEQEVRIFSNSLWCPGRTEIVYLKVENKEQFPVETTVKLNVISNGFGDYMKVACITGRDLISNPDETITSWKTFCDKATSKETLKDSFIVLDAKKNDALAAVSGEQYMALAIHMDENTPSTYEGQTMELQFSMQVDADYKPNDKLPTPTP